MNLADYGAVLAAAIAVWLVVEPANVKRARHLSIRADGRQPRQALHEVISRMRGVSNRGKRRDDRRKAIMRALTALGSELQSGQNPARALENVTDDPQVWPHAWAAARGHGDIAAGLTVDSQGSHLLGHLSALWRLSERSGVGLADSVGRLASSARREEEVRVQLQAQLAGPRATARVLSFLPLIGLALGMLLGAQPLVWLLTTAMGWVCLAAGGVLTGLGLLWTRRIAAGVESKI